MQGAEERRLRRINNTPQGEATEGNTADDTLLVSSIAVRDCQKEIIVVKAYNRSPLLDVFWGIFYILRPREEKYQFTHFEPNTTNGVKRDWRSSICRYRKR